MSGLLVLDAASLAGDLADLGVRRGDRLLVHTSLTAVRGVALLLGGPVAVVDALTAAVGEEGLVVMPTFSADCSEPSLWVNPPVPSSAWQPIRDGWPAYRPDLTPSRGVGVLPETFRSMAGVHRSAHPQSSFAAWGRAAAALVEDHPLAHSLGEGSPLGRLYEGDARVLLLGCGYDRCTALHLAETRSSRGPSSVRQGAAVVRDGARAWVTFEEPEWRTDDFARLGADFELHGDVRHGLVGHAHGRLLSLRAIVDFAVPWFDAHR